MWRGSENSLSSGSRTPPTNRDSAVQQLSAVLKKRMIVGEVRRVIVAALIAFVIRLIEDCEQTSVEEVNTRGVRHNGVPGPSIPWRAHFSGQTHASGAQVRKNESKIRYDNSWLYLHKEL
jgi:hypothetical protein